MSGNHPSQLSPRQRMINMMYLVLTALLALNVSKEVLQSFFEVNLGIIKTTETVEEKSARTLLDLQEDTREKVKKFRNLAEDISRNSLEVSEFIQEMKYSLVLKVDGKVYLNKYEGKDDESAITDPYNKDDHATKKIAWLNNKSNRDASGSLFNPINQVKLEGNARGSKENQGLATQLKIKIQEYNNNVTEILRKIKNDTAYGIHDVENLNATIDEIHALIDIGDENDYGEDKNESWEEFNFLDMPAVGALTLLTKWQADVKNVESIVLSFLANSVDAESFKFTEAVGKAIPSSTFVGRGDKFSAEILVYAYDPTLQGKIYLGWDNEDKSDPENPKYSGGLHIGDLVNGKGLWETKAGGSGLKNYKGYIELEQKGDMKYFPFEGEYTVGDQKATVSPDYFLAMYAGYSNPITVSVPGYNSKDLKVRVDNGSIGGSSGKYNVTPKRKGPLKVSVSAAGKNLGSVLFEVHNVPDPHIRFKGLRSGATVTKDKLISSAVPTLVLHSLMKQYKGLKYRTNGFDIIVSPKSGPAKVESNCKSLQTGKGRSIIAGCRSGDKVTIDNIKYTRFGSSTGKVKKKYPGSMTFNIK